MFTRVRMTLIGIVGVLAAVAIALSIVQLANYDHRQSAGSVPAPLVVGTALQKPRPVPVIGLQSQTGATTSLAAWRGRWVVLAPSMTLCHEVCPITTAALMELQQRLAAAGLARQVAVVEATVDPWRDSPLRLRAYRRLSGASFAMLTGPYSPIKRLWSFFGVYFKRVPQGRPPDVDWLTGKPETFDVDHTDAFFIIDPAGQERVVDEGMPALSGSLSPRLHALLSSVGDQNLAHPQLAWTAGEILDDLYYLMNRNVPASALPRASAPSAAQAQNELAGSPHPLQTLHQQAGRLLTGESLPAALSGLRGYPVVVNAWASWCGPCKSEFPLFASASARFGRRVAFLGNDTDDSSSSARSFLSQHPVSYPSLQGSETSLTSLAQIEGLPTTIFLNGRGQVVFVHTGSYQSQTALDQNIERYALGASA